MSCVMYRNIVPMIFDDSLSYYEQLMCLSNKINEIIKNINGDSDNCNDIISLSNYPRLEGETDDTARFKRASIAASLTSGILYISSGEYWIKGEIYTDNLHIVGEAKPFYDGALLKGGTIIHGYINFNSRKYCSIENVGIDNRNMYNDSGDGVEAGLVPSSVELWHYYRNLIVVGGWNNTPNQHGILVQAGEKVFISDVEVYNFMHGIAFRSSNCSAINIKCYNCTSSTVIIKATTENTPTRNIYLSNILGELSSWENSISSVEGIYIQSQYGGSLVENIRISDVCINTGQSFLTCDSIEGGIIRNIIAENLMATNCGYSGHVFSLKGADHCLLTNLSSFSTRGWQIQCDYGFNDNTVNGLITDSDPAYYLDGECNMSNVNSTNYTYNSIISEKYITGQSTIYESLVSVKPMVINQNKLLVFDLGLNTETNVAIAIEFDYCGNVGGQCYFNKTISQVFLSGGVATVKNNEVFNGWSGGSFSCTLNYEFVLEGNVVHCYVTSSAYEIYGSMRMVVHNSNNNGNINFVTR